MFWIKRALAVSLLVFSTVMPVCAFTFLYGNVVEVKEVRNTPRLKMPLTRKKYKNVGILSKDLYRFLRQCAADCSYPAGQVQFEISDYRVVKTKNQAMLIAQVDFNQELAVTFLVFKNPETISVKTPEPVVFKDAGLEKQVINSLEELGQKLL